MTTASEIATEHTEPWCDTTIHILPPPDGQEDPGCHRLIHSGGMWWMIHRLGRRIVVSDDQGNTWPAEIARLAFVAAVEQLAFIPRQRSA